MKKNKNDKPKINTKTINCKQCGEPRRKEGAGKCPDGHGVICYPCANVRGLDNQCPLPSKKAHVCGAKLVEIGTRRKKGKR